MLDEQAIAFGEIAIDFNRMELRRSGRVVHATSLEFRLLKFFVDHSGQVFSREELMDRVWPKRKRANGRTVDNTILQLRRKIEEDPAAPEYIRTQYGVGYKFVGASTDVSGPASNWNHSD